MPRHDVASMARPRSAFVNQRASSTTSAAASAAPSRNRTTISAVAELSRPCAVARTPQASTE
ncbi:hypothetical protein [Amycolatopsis minnesotensis]|uniref:hypothetical protein n=1 Tax=Amycolatopsis minnesotensis TaxID=337894 RepID=UPI0031D119FA